MENEQISKAFEELLKNGKEFVYVKFESDRNPSRSENKPVSNPYKYQGRIILTLTQNDTPQQIAELIVKTEEAIGQLEKEKSLIKAHDKAHPDLFERLNNINRYEGVDQYR